MPPGRRPPDLARGRRRSRWARRLHRWLGIGTLLFAIALSVSGIMLNHARSLGLTERYVQAGWLLDFYGIEAPEPAASYRAGAHRVTQLGSRIYFDQRELAADAGALAGAVEVDDIYAVAAGGDVLLVTVDGDLIERMEVAPGGAGSIARIGRDKSAVVVNLGGARYRSDARLLTFSAADRYDAAEVAWSVESPISASQLATLKQLYRGRGVTGERLLADLHSGRLFGRYGPLLMDAAGLALLVLGISGLILFLRRKRR